MRLTLSMCIVVALFVVSRADTIAADATCHPSRAVATSVEYRQVGNATGVYLDAWCDAPGGSYVVSEWYVSFFVGAQPTLWEWVDITNTASKLVRAERSADAKPVATWTE